VEEARPVSDLGTFVLCTAVCAASFLAWPVPRWVGVVLVVVALVLRRPTVLVVGAALLASSLAAAAWAGLGVPASSASFAGRATLVADPVDAFGSVRVDLRLAGSGRRVEAWADGAPASSLRSRLAGEVVVVQGRLRAPPPSQRARLAVRHVAVRLDVSSVDGWSPGSRASQLANGLRRRLTGGAGSLDIEARSLLLGVVLGDDREQPPELGDAFRAAGLSHLLAVSGQNVAFVLALCSPVLVRLGLRSRLAVTLALLAFFGLLTRWEPSVLRAGAMAALACTAATVGRPTARLRLLALAVTACVLVDPLLVRSVGFQLSVGATWGIALLAAPLSSWLRGPRWLAEPLAVTIAAQVGVAPVAVPLFGGIPLASLPANLLAVPAAAPLTAWGLTGGLVAGVAGRPFDGWLHVPSRFLAGWLAGVARWAEGLPVGQLRGPHVVALVGAGVLAAAVRARWWRR
jgi:competence protein ComEC